jgi:hypothetical protein
MVEVALSIIHSSIQQFHAMIPFNMRAMHDEMRTSLVFSDFFGSLLLERGVSE